MKSPRHKAGLAQDGQLETAKVGEADELRAGRLGTMRQLHNATEGWPDEELVDRLALDGQPETVTVGEPDEARVGRLRSIGRPLTRSIGKLSRLPVRILRRALRPLIGAVVAALVLVVAVFSGTVLETDRTLVIMGFDPDRAQLITTLVVGGIAAAAVTLAAGRTATGVLLGTWAVAMLFGQTFIAETQNAISATGALGSFDLIGWIVSLVTLVVIGFISAWAGATLAAAIRPPLIATGASIREMIEDRRPNRHAARRPLAAVLTLGLLVVAVPAFGDMVNLAPDSLMLNGGHFIPLAPGNAVPVGTIAPTPLETPSASPSPSPTSAPSATSVAQVATSSPSPGPTRHVNPDAQPWLAWRPTGSGKVTPVTFYAPWIGGTLTTVVVNVYTPPGYATYDAQRYPVLYEAPTGLDLWNSGTGVIGALDELIDSGAMPAAIVAFIDSAGATYPDSQCADSSDQRMWFETFVWKDVVQYVDAHFKTIKDPIARGVMGQSAGGFCAAMLVSRHPDVFGTSISFSGYFYAGLGSGSAGRPYGGSQAAMDAVSPALLVPNLSDQEKARLYFIVVAAPAQELYGPQAENFERILAANHVGYDAVKSIWVHSWTQVRKEFPPAVEAWAVRLVVNGVW